MIETYYLIFTTSDRWFAAYLKRGFSHITIYKLINDGEFIEVQPLWNLNFKHRKVEAGKLETVLAKLKSTYDCRILKVEIDSSEIPELQLCFLSSRWGIFNCVILAKYLLALRSWCITPYGVYKNLINKYFKHKNKHIKKIGVI